MFGENFLLFKSDAYVAARTLSFCDFATLQRADFMAVLERFPAMYEPLRAHTVKSLWQRIFRALLALDPGDIATIQRGLAHARDKEAATGEAQANPQARGGAAGAGGADGQRLHDELDRIGKAMGDMADAFSSRMAGLKQRQRALADSFSGMSAEVSTLAKRRAS